MFEVGPEDMMAVLDLLQGGVEFALQLLGDATAEDLRDLVGRQSPESNLAGAFEDPVNGGVALEDEIAAVLDLVDGVKAAEIHSSALALGELRTQNQSPVFEALANDIRGEPVGGRLQGGGVIDGQEGVIVFAEADFFPVQFLFDEGVAVEVVGGLEGKEGGHAQHHRPQGFIPQVEVVMGVSAALLAQNPMVGILGRELGNGATESGPLFHALENEIDAIAGGPLHAAEPRPDVILFADTFLRPLDGDLMIASERLHPLPIVAGSLAEHGFVDHGHAHDVAEKVDHLLGAGQAAQVAVDDDAVEAVVYKNEQAVELSNSFANNSIGRLPDFASATRSSVRR